MPYRTLRRYLPASAVLCLLAWTAALPSAARAQDVKGSLFIVGGGSRPPELMRRFIRLAGGAGKANIVVIPNASATPEETGADQAKEMRGLGARATSLVLDRARAEDPATAAVIDSATGIWFSGGDQVRVPPILRGTPTLDAIMRRYREGAVVGGTSAGAAIMSDPMLTGEQTKAGEDTAGYYGDTYTRIARDYIQLVPGLGFLPGVLVDQHFFKRERHNRLISAVLSHPDRPGVGIDESTVLIVRPDGTWQIEGASAAIVYDARQATLTPPDAPVLGATGVRVTILPAGSTYDPRTGKATLPGG